MNGNTRLLCKILTISKQKPSRFELASEHGTLNKFYPAEDIMKIPSCVEFTPVKFTKKIPVRTAVKMTYAPLNISAEGAAGRRSNRSSNRRGSGASCRR